MRKPGVRAIAPPAAQRRACQMRSFRSKSRSVVLDVRRKACAHLRRSMVNNAVLALGFVCLLTFYLPKRSGWWKLSLSPIDDHAPQCGWLEASAHLVRAGWRLGFRWRLGFGWRLGLELGLGLGQPALVKVGGPYDARCGQARAVRGGHLGDERVRDRERDCPCLAGQG